MLKRVLTGWKMQPDELELGNHYFAAIIAKIESGKSHQRVLNSWRNFDEEQHVILNVFGKLEAY